MLLVLRGTPATVDEELDPVVRGISCSSAQGTEESWIKVGYTRNLVIKDRRAVGDGTVSLAITLFSRPMSRLARLAGPLAGIAQGQLTNRYFRSLAEG